MRVACRYSLSCHSYADDTQLYISARPTSTDMLHQVAVLEACCHDIRDRMSVNCLKLNDDKMDVLVVGSSTLLSKLPRTVVSINSHEITTSSKIKSLDVIFDCNMSMKSHIKDVSCIAMHHLHNISKINISKIKRYLGQSTTEQIIHMLVTSRIDYCNAVLASLPTSCLPLCSRCRM